jgi:hypothetical protein
VKWTELDPKARRKALMLGAIVGLALLVLLWPAGMTPKLPLRRPPSKPSPAGKPVPVLQRAATAPQAVPMPPPDPMHKLLGKWGGRNRSPTGACAPWA